MVSRFFLFRLKTKNMPAGDILAGKGWCHPLFVIWINLKIWKGILLRVYWKILKKVSRVS